MIRIEVQNKSPKRIKGSLLILPVRGDVSAHEGGDTATRIMRRRNFSGKLGEQLDLGKISGISALKVVAFGTGKELGEIEIVRQICGGAVLVGKEHGIADVIVALPSEKSGERHGRAAAEGALLADYRFSKYKGEREKEENRNRVRKVVIAAAKMDTVATKTGVRLGTCEAEAAIVARDLVNTPSQHMTPKILAEHAKGIANASKSITIKLLNITDVEKEGMGAFSAVAQGSDEPLKFIHLKYTPEKSKSQEERVLSVALVGKGITFDSGGYSLKTSEGMEAMKTDMAGAAAVLGVFSALAVWKPEVEVHGIIAACENMISGRAIKPGDIVRAKNGKTIEILNTDAEGRLTLADALSYAKDQKPDAIIDMATLTGASVVALGEEIAALFGNNEELVEKVTEAAKQSGEQLWRLPLYTKYSELIKSELADLRNIRGKGHGGGSITAALFLKEFVGKTPWVHLDIAGPAYVERPLASYIPIGGTGFGVRTILHYLESLTL